MAKPKTFREFINKKTGKSIWYELDLEECKKYNLPCGIDDYSVGKEERTGNNVKYWFKCQTCRSSWAATIYSRTKGSGCPSCSGHAVTKSNCLATLNPKLAKEWNYEKNSPLTPKDVTVGSGKKVWWICKDKNCEHSWNAVIAKRSNGQGCPACNQSPIRTEAKRILKEFTDKNILKNMDPAIKSQILYALSIVSDSITHKNFFLNLAKDASQERLDVGEVEKFVNGEPSKLDEIYDKLETDSLENSVDTVDETNDLKSDNVESSDDNLKKIEETIETICNIIPDDKKRMTVPGIKNLTFIEYFLSLAESILWKKAYKNEKETVDYAKKPTDSYYWQTAAENFLRLYDLCQELNIPKIYHRDPVSGKFINPYLAQKLCVAKLKEMHSLLNTSDTGQGKTLATVLATIILLKETKKKTKVVLAIVPNATIKENHNQWKKTIKYFKDEKTHVLTNNMNPGKITEPGITYLIYNHEKFQQEGAKATFEKIIEQNNIDFMIIDEIHLEKIRTIDDNDASKRCKLISNLRIMAEEKNHDLYVIGMSATPVVNNLKEAKILIEMVK